jgi:hypothetical protein
VSLESVERERKIGEAMLPPEEARALTPAEGNMISSHVVAVNSDEGTHVVARGADASTQGESHAQSLDSATANADASAVEPAPQSPHKTDWL